MQEKKTIKNGGAAVGGGGGGTVPEGNIVLRLEADAKASVFNVLYILLKDSDISFWKLAFLLVIDFLQMVQYSFAACVSGLWSDF
jgi:hypothetical protein